MALVTRDGDHKISVLSVDGTKVEYTKRDINAGLRPYGIDVSSKGDFAAVANIGIGQGDTDTVSLIDIRAKPPRVVETVSVGQTPEGIKGLARRQARRGRGDERQQQGEGVAVLRRQRPARGAAREGHGS